MMTKYFNCCVWYIDVFRIKNVSKICKKNSRAVFKKKNVDNSSTSTKGQKIWKLLWKNTLLFLSFIIQQKIEKFRFLKITQKLKIYWRCLCHFKSLLTVSFKPPCISNCFQYTPDVHSYLGQTILVYLRRVYPNSR